MAEQLNLGNLYDLVWDGTWTLDRMYQFMQTAANDTDGDGDMDENDRRSIKNLSELMELFNEQ